jgi:hypothetical protein
LHVAFSLLTLEPGAVGARFVVSLPFSESAATPGRA